MNNTRQRFEDVANWCERHLTESRDSKVALAFSAALRVLGQIAELPENSIDPSFRERRRGLVATSQWLLDEAALAIVGSTVRGRPTRTVAVNPVGVSTNFVYDSGSEYRSPSSYPQKPPTLPDDGREMPVYQVPSMYGNQPYPLYDTGAKSKSYSPLETKNTWTYDSGESRLATIDPLGCRVNMTYDSGPNSIVRELSRRPCNPANEPGKSSE